MVRAWIIVVAIAGVAHAEPDAGEYAALRDVLGEASSIVRGSAIETTRGSGYVDTQFAVTEALRGPLDGDTITVREPADMEPFDRGDDTILLLDRKTAEGVYPVHLPAGRYRVEGGAVIVNASGVDGAAVSAKDLRPRAPDERIGLEQFRVLAGAPPFVTPNPPPPRPAAPVPAGARTPAPPPSETAPARWPWIVAGLAAALVLYGVLRARAS